jgi:hypothetical protein
MDPKAAVLGQDWSGWDFLGIVSGFVEFVEIKKFCFLLSILRLSSTMMCSLPHLMCLDRSPVSLNE